MKKHSVALSFRPCLSAELTEKNLSTLLVRGTLQSHALDSAIIRLDKRFQTYCACYPHGLWAPGLVISGDMRGSTEQYLPMTEIRSAFRHFFSASLRYLLADANNPVHGATTWLDLLQRLRLSRDSVNPATLLRKMITDEPGRIHFLFSALLPHYHGGCFLRYPEQMLFLKGWIHQNRRQLSQEVRCLDAACGAGEGTYDLADLLGKCSIPVHAQQVHGSSLEPLEVFTAAHGFFPHDPERQKRFRTFVEPLLTKHVAKTMLFFQDNIMRHPSHDEKPYDVILCNGLLGGPFLHEQEMLENAITALAKRLKVGGIFLAADKFHGGWKKAGAPMLIEESLKRNGFALHRISEGIAAEKIGW